MEPSPMWGSCRKSIRGPRRRTAAVAAAALTIPAATIAEEEKRERHTHTHRYGGAGSGHRYPSRDQLACTKSLSSLWITWNTNTSMYEHLTHIEFTNLQPAKIHCTKQYRHFFANLQMSPLLIYSICPLRFLHTASFIITSHNCPSR